MIHRRFSTFLRMATAGTKNGVSPLVERDPVRARVSHLLRRAALAPHPRQVERLSALSWDDAVDALLAESVKTVTPPKTDEWDSLATWWLEQMLAPDGAVAERMTWFWHTHLTTNAYKVDAELLPAQLEVLRANALGNFRELLHEFVTDGALLQYLDASGSLASNPNENLGRELMELFTVGRGHYTQEDVRAASRALAGWVVDDDGVRLERANAFQAPLIFMGEQANWDTTSVVDRLCDHPATAVNVAAKLWSDLTGSSLAPDSADELGAWWQGQDLEIQPLIGRILRSDNFFDARYTRPRSGLEWWLAVRTALDAGVGEGIWPLENLGQMPYLPPNVAGWPTDNRWLSGGSLLARAANLWNIDYTSLVGDVPADTDTILDRCGLYEVSQATVDALTIVDSEPDLSDEGKLHLRWRLALSCPEFNVA